MEPFFNRLIRRNIGEVPSLEPLIPSMYEDSEGELAGTLIETTPSEKDVEGEIVLHEEEETLTEPAMMARRKDVMDKSQPPKDPKVPYEVHHPPKRAEMPSRIDDRIQTPTPSGKETRIPKEPLIVPKAPEPKSSEIPQDIVDISNHPKSDNDRRELAKRENDIRHSIIQEDRTERYSTFPVLSESRRESITPTDMAPRYKRDSEKAPTIEDIIDYIEFTNRRGMAPKDGSGPVDDLSSSTMQKMMAVEPLRFSNLEKGLETLQRRVEDIEREARWFKDNIPLDQIAAPAPQVAMGQSLVLEPAPLEPALSLDDYLKGRDGEDR